MSLIIPANSLAGGGYAVDNSLRFNPSSSDYLNRTQATATDRKKVTLSTWVKRSNLTADYQFFVSSYISGTDRIAFYFNSDESLSAFASTAGTTLSLQTSALYRDVSAWYHVVYSIDTTQATSSNRVKMYVNGEQITSFQTATYPTINSDLQLGTASYNMYVGTYDATQYYFSGYLSETYLIDGQQLTPTDFGEFDADSGIWKPIVYEGTYGTNGFFLEFQDSGALGTDSSGNANTFTVNNLTSIDQTTDTPTNNFATFNPLVVPNVSGTLSNGNLTNVAAASGWGLQTSTIGFSTGKWYWELKLSGTTYGHQHGVIDETVNFGASNPHILAGATVFYNGDGGEMKVDGIATTNDYGEFVSTDIMGVALDYDAGTITIYKNGSLLVNAYSISTTKNTLFPCLVSGSSVTVDANFGNAPYTITTGNADANGFGNFEYEVPAGFLALCTSNLSEVNS
jgi:hypothetical protein